MICTLLQKNKIIIIKNKIEKKPPIPDLYSSMSLKFILIYFPNKSNNLNPFYIFFILLNSF